jgi:hypothetical protein
MLAERNRQDGRRDARSLRARERNRREQRYDRWLHDGPEGA